MKTTSKAAFAGAAPKRVLGSVFLSMLICAPFVAQAQQTPDNERMDTAERDRQSKAIAAAASFAADPNIAVTLADENDLYAFEGEDRWYTRGGAIKVLLPRAQTSAWLPKVTYGAQRLELSLGQQIFTPTDLDAPNAVADDRPYGGYLYLGGEIIALSPDGSLFGVSTLTEDRLGMRLGVIGGSLSLGEFTQDTSHTLFHGQTAQGWDQGLENEPALTLTGARSYRVFGEMAGLDTELRPHGSFALGNVDTHAAAGVSVSIGDQLHTALAPSSGNLVPTQTQSGRVQGWGWSFSAGLEGRAVGYNAFIDGNLLADGPNAAIDIEREPLVGDAWASLAFYTDRLRLTYAYTVRTEEFDTQTRPQAFGSINLGFRF
ncbi:MAG: lipid A deacylase LpxR family protein [Neomegalonema sp.]|nr:lipid A deacylase LpxR family protein [Neomegalonema sp.]